MHHRFEGWFKMFEIFRQTNKFSIAGDAVHAPRLSVGFEEARQNCANLFAVIGVTTGVAQGGEPTADSGMPVAIEDISNIWTGLKANTVSNTYQGNTTYDVYFTNAETYVGGPPDTYLMVWYDAKGLNQINGEGEGWNCNANPPTYVDSCSGAGDVTIAGTKFYRFIGNNGGHGVISYVPETRMGEWEFDLKAFIDDAVAQGVLTPAMYMQSVQAGLELADGGAGLTIEDFYIDII